MKTKRLENILKIVILLSVLPYYANCSVSNNCYSQASPISSETPEIILQQGTVGTSTIYTNNTSAKISVAAPTWWSNDYDYRKRITITNNNATASIPAKFTINFTVDTQQMVNDGKLQADGDDFRIVWWNSSNSSWLELDRLNMTNFNTTATLIKFRTQVTILGGSIDENHFIYHGNSAATSPPANASNVYFFEDLFNRADSSAVGFEWIEYDGIVNVGTSDARILNNQLNLRSANSAYDTQAYHMLDGLTNRSVWELEWNFARNGSETTYSMWMQLGKNSLMSNTSNTAGASVYLDWTGTGAVHGGAASAHEMLRVWNGSLISEVGVLSGSHVIKLDMDLTAGSFTLYIDGNNNGTYNVYQKLSSCDCIRFVFEYATVDNFASYSFDSTQVYLAIDPNPSVSLGSEERNLEDYVDNNTSDVGSPSDRGTHSNFTAQQYGPDSVYDTLIEENITGSIVFESSAESYSSIGQSSHNFNYALQKGSGNDRLVVVTVSWEDAEASASISSLTFGSVAMTKVADVTVGAGYSEYISLWYLLDSSLPSSTGSYNIAVAVSEGITREIYMAVAEYSGVKQSAPDDYDTNANPVAGNTAVTLTAVANGSLVVAGVGEGGTNVLTDTNNINNLQEQLLTSSGSALGHHVNASSGNITVGWNALSTREGMAGAVWQPASNYNIDLEVQWTTADFDETNEELCINGGTMGTENITVDVWNGTAWENLFADLASGWNNISVSSYLTSSTFTIRFKGGNETGDIVQDSWNIDTTFLHVWTGATYDYVLRIVNQAASNWTINLQAYDSSSIGRLSSLNISLHDGTSSNQIAIRNGSIVQGEGESYNLPEGVGTTIYVTISNLQAASSGTSCLYVNLKMQVPNTSTYNFFIITFEIT